MKQGTLGMAPPCKQRVPHCHQEFEGVGLQSQRQSVVALEGREYLGNRYEERLDGVHAGGTGHAMSREILEILGGVLVSS